jgi:peroxiredoxin Q/BCP
MLDAGCWMLVLFPSIQHPASFPREKIIMAAKSTAGETKELKVGDKAPAFSLKNTEGKTVKLSDYKGKKVVLYFYPKDMTPGCTKEACGFRDDYTQLKKRGVVVIGVSGDDQSSHQKFTEKYSLPFTLLSDPDHEMI